MIHTICPRNHRCRKIVRRMYCTVQRIIKKLFKALSARLDPYTAQRFLYFDTIEQAMSTSIACIAPPNLLRPDSMHGTALSSMEFIP